MAFTLLNFQDTVHAVGLAGRQDVSLAQITRFLNLAQERLARIEDWRELRQVTDITLGYTAVAATDKTINLLTKLSTTAAIFRDVYSIVLEDGASSIKLTQVSPQELDERLPLPEYNAARHPAVYSLWTPTDVILWPAPDAAYTARVRWTKWPTPLSADGDVSDLDHKDELIVQLTLSFVHSMLRNEEDALGHFAIYQSLLREATKEEGRNPDLLVVRPNFLSNPNAGRPERWKDPFARS